MQGFVLISVYFYRLSGFARKIVQRKIVVGYMEDIWNYGELDYFLDGLEEENLIIRRNTLLDDEEAFQENPSILQLSLFAHNSRFQLPSSVKGTIGEHNTSLRNISGVL